MKLLLVCISIAFFAFASCSGAGGDKQSSGTPAPMTEEEKMLAEGKGIGEIKFVDLKTPLEADRVTRGEAIYEMKCLACHRLDEKRVVGPGWKGITQNRKPEWIMNMITNVDVMLEKDDEAQKLLELCLTRMPNQNVSVGDARDVLEFMRKNDDTE